MNTIRCGQCGEQYPAIFSKDASQARGCSAEVTDGRLLGHYGSETSDMDVLDFVETPPIDGTLICDKCISKGLENGTLVRPEGHSGRKPGMAETRMMMQLLDRRR